MRLLSDSPPEKDVQAYKFLPKFENVIKNLKNQHRLISI